jgi:probable HAF family extracellular repeat protein
MKRRASNYFYALTTACLVLAAGANLRAQAPPAVNVAVDLAPIVGVHSTADGVNDLGMVVGTRSFYGMDMAYTWTAVAGATDLGFGTALAVNNHGVVAGHSLLSGWVPAALLWSNGGESEIASGVAYSLNDAGAVVGYHYPPSLDVIRAFRWTASAGREDFESLAGAFLPWSYFGPSSEARFIRHDGVIAGWRGGWGFEAVVWQPSGEFSVLGPGVAMSINDNDVAVGATGLGEPNYAGRPIVWRAGAATELSAAPGEARGVNTAGYVVGWMTVAGARHAFVWHDVHRLQDLGPGEARGVNDAGRIVGYRTTTEGRRATVWQIDLPVRDALIGLEAMARRLLGDPTGKDGKDARAVLNNLRLASEAFARPSPAPVAGRHLERALTQIAAMAGTGALDPAAADALLSPGSSIRSALR